MSLQHRHRDFCSWSEQPDVFVTFNFVFRSLHISPRSSMHHVTTIVSGGQTGVDRAALDAAMASGIAVGGWCPRDRRSEDGAVPRKYPLNETAARSYAVRTEWNVRDSDGTLVLVLDVISSGTRLTIDAARAHGKPLKIEHLAPCPPAGLLTPENSWEEQAVSVVDWVRRHKIRVLNVAGPRGSSSKKIYPMAREFMTMVLDRLRKETPASVPHASEKPATTMRRRKIGRAHV